MASGKAKDGDSALSEAEIKALSARLKKGQYLDDHLRDRLFRQPREYELTYAGKLSRGAILAETMAVPLQPLKQFNGDGEEWTNKLIFGDNLQVLKTLFEAKERGELTNADGSSGIRLCYIDPPFATKQEFRGRKGQKAYRDKVVGAQFVEFLRRRLILIYELLSADGTLYVHLDTKKAHYVKVLLDEIFGEDAFRNEIIWKRSDAHSDARGQGGRDFGRIHDLILRYSKSNAPYFDPQHLPLPDSTADRWYRHIEPDTGRRFNKADVTGPGGAAKGNPRYEIFGITRYWRYSKKRMEELIKEGKVCQDKPGNVPYLKRYLDESPGVALQDIWTDIQMLRGYTAGSNGERTDYPTQKPNELLERIIKSSSKEGDLVLDCFAGSGTAAVAAEKLGRRWIAVDYGKFAVYTAQRRLLRLAEGNGKDKDKIDVKPFELCAAGLYDNECLEELPFEPYKEFCLELFGCRPGEKKVAGVPMVGTRKGGPVHLFPFNKTDAVMGRAYIESLHDRLKTKVSGPVYVIAPVSACDPGWFEDVVRLDENVYFILRVPYSVIEALHDRDFELPPQPTSADEVNDALDAYGFDFVHPPEVTVAYTRPKGAIKAEVKKFQRGGLDPDEFKELEEQGRADLAMVMVDAAYDGKVFRLSDQFFADDLERASWKFEIPRPPRAKKALVIFMDVHGNERREVVEFATPKAKAKKKPAKTTVSKARSSRAKGAPKKTRAKVAKR